MTTDSNHIFPPPLIVEEPFVSEAAADNAAARGELLEESDEIDGGDLKAVLDFRAATLSALRVGANDPVASGDGHHFVETARFVIEQSGNVSILPAASAGGEETVLICSSTELGSGRVEHYSASGALLSERRWTDRIPLIATASPLFFGRRFVAMQIMTAGNGDRAVLVVDADDLARDVLAVPASADPSVPSPQFFVTLDSTLMLSVGVGGVLFVPTEFHLYAFDRAAGTFAHALTVDHAALGVEVDALEDCRDSFRFVDGRLVFSNISLGICHVTVARIERAARRDGSPRWRLGDVTRVQLSEATSIAALSVAPRGRLLTAVEAPPGFDSVWVEQLYSAHDVVSAADGARVDPIGRWEQDALPPALEFGMPVRPSIANMRFGDVEDGHCRTGADAPLVVGAPRNDFSSLCYTRECRFFRRVAGTLVATHQLSRADLDDDGVRSMRIANRDRVVIELNSGAERVFALPDASLCDGDTEDDRRDRAARQAARDERHQRRVRDVAARRQQQELQLGGE